MGGNSSRRNSSGDHPDPKRKKYYQHNKEVLGRLKEGDIVKFKRKGYYHFGVCMGVCEPLQCQTDKCIPLQCQTDKCIPLQCQTDKCIPLQCQTDKCIPLQCQTDKCIPLQCQTDKGIAHVTGDNTLHQNVFSSISGRHSPKATVLIESFWKVAADSPAEICNSLDAKCRASDFKTIKERVSMRENRIFNYNLIYCNCEHFANYCRYGVWKSSQTAYLKVILQSVLSFTVLLL